jgi:hypothetical protein
MMKPEKKGDGHDQPDRQENSRLSDSLERVQATTIIQMLQKHRFDLTRRTPAEADEHSTQARQIASRICQGVDLDALAAFPQDFIYKKQSLLHLLAWTRPALYVSDAYAVVEDAIEILTRPNPLTGTCRFDLEQVDGVWGYTPLHYAAAFGSARVFQILLEAGASLDAVTTGGMYPSMLAHRTPLGIAQAEGRNSIIQVIEAWQASRKIQGVLAHAGVKQPKQDGRGAA